MILRYDVNIYSPLSYISNLGRPPADDQRGFGHHLTGGGSQPNSVKVQRVLQLTSNHTFKTTPLKSHLENLKVFVLS